MDRKSWAHSCLFLYSTGHLRAAHTVPTPEPSLAPSLLYVFLAKGKLLGHCHLTPLAGKGSPCPLPLFLSLPQIKSLPKYVLGQIYQETIMNKKKRVWPRYTTCPSA